MDRRQLGASDVEVSRLVLGCGNFGGVGSAPELFGKGEDDDAAFRIMDGAWELGITTFDTADAYGGGRSESAIGKWITSRGVRPEIATKTFNPMEPGADHGLSRTRITRQLESSLDRLGVGHVDVYFAHAFDPDTPVADTVTTFNSLQQLGLIKAWGVSNYTADNLREVLEIDRPAVVQNSYSLLDRDDEKGVLELCREFDIAYVPHSPLAGGILTGKYRGGEDPPADSRLALRPGPYEQLLDEKTFEGLERFKEVAARHGVAPATLGLAWLLAQPAVTAVVFGPRGAEHLDPAVAALDVRLSPAEADELASLF
jgi:aryl-alcohol dehydrogenase-like predicted oxidoreductase